MNITYRQFENCDAKAVATLQNQWADEGITFGFFADDENENCQDYEPCTDFDFNFCPKCGADMRGDKNE